MPSQSSHPCAGARRGAIRWVSWALRGEVPDADWTVCEIESEVVLLY